jgi:ABC-type multidrug transport system fused ATPase/permease subunit
MSVGTFIMINTYMLRIVSPIETLGYAMQGLSQGVAMLKKLMDLLQEVREPEQTLEGTWHEGPGRLEFRDVCLAYSEDLPVLKRLSFTVPAGTTLGIVGTSGAGKSTIVRLLVRLLEPNDGVILLDGASISEVPVAQLRKAIAVVPQDTVLFNDSIAYNIGFGKAGSSMHEVQEAAKIAHLHDFIMTLPEQYETRVGERGVKLSGGERQRVSIARAVLKNPQIYVFDEATSSLDSRTEAEILRNLSEVSRLSTTVVIAHRLSTVVNADMIVVLDNGAVVERGTHEALLRHSGKYAALWHAQQSRASKLDSTMSVACEDA